MAENPTAIRRCAQIAIATCAILLLGAVIFYKQRMVFSDASLISFRRINLQDLESSQRRWGAFITECVPLILSKLGLPLRLILIAYSVSFNLLYLAVLCLLILHWRFYRLGLLMSCYYLLFASSSYYWTNNEIHQAVAYIFLCVGLCYQLNLRNSRKLWQYVAFILLSGLAIFTHPLAIIAFAFLWGALWLSRTDWPYSRKQAIHYALILFAWSIIKLWLSSGQAYDARRMHGITHPDMALFTSAFSGKAAVAFYKASVKNYWLSMFLAMTGAITILKKGNWLLASWVFMSGAGMIMLVHFGFPEGHFFYYLEGEWQTMGIIAGFPIVYYLLPALRGNTSVVLVALLFASRIYFIAVAAAPFTQRIIFIESLNDYARRYSKTKVLIKASDSRFEERLIMDWGLATESMTLSALAGDKPQITLCALWPDHPEHMPQGNKEMVWNFDKRPSSALNARYFMLDTTRPYVIIPFEQIESELR